jgi:hypothetical protein
MSIREVLTLVKNSVTCTGRFVGGGIGKDNPWVQRRSGGILGAGNFLPVLSHCDDAGRAIGVALDQRPIPALVNPHFDQSIWPTHPAAQFLRAVTRHKLLFKTGAVVAEQV